MRWSARNYRNIFEPAALHDGAVIIEGGSEVPVASCLTSGDRERVEQA